MKSLPFYFLPLLSGFFMGTSYMPFPPWALFFCFVPLWLFALKREKLKPLLMGGWLCQFLGSLIGFSWLAFAIGEFGFLSWPWPLLGLLAFAGFANLHIPISLGLWLISKKALAYLPKKLSLSAFFPQKGGKPLSVFNRLYTVPAFLFQRGGKPLSFKKGQKAESAAKPSGDSWLLWLLLPLYSALSWEYYPMIFEWHFGYAWLYAGWPAFQTAEIWGFKFLNTWTLFLNFLFLAAFKSLSWPRKGFFKALFPQEGNNSRGRESERKFSLVWLKKILFLFRSAPKPFALLAFWLALFLSLNFFGVYLKSRWPEPDKKARILFVQPNIKNHQQGKEEWDDFILSELARETSKIIWPDLDNESQERDDPTAGALTGKNRSEDPISFAGKEGGKKQPAPENQPYQKTPPPDLILWPEGAYPYNIDKSQALRGEDPAQKWPAVFRAPLAVSAGGVGPQGHYNSVFVFDETGALAQEPYDKTVLMPFGEYVPFERLFPFLSRFLFGDISFERGTGQNKTVRLNGLNFGLSICYESLFDSFFRSLALEGADVLLNFANEAWFGLRQEPYQNLYMTLARAVELRRPLARAANSGFSAVISAKGDISGPGKLGAKLAWMAEVPYYSEENKRLSLFALWGYYINQVFIWLALLASHLALWRSHFVKLSLAG